MLRNPYFLIHLCVLLWGFTAILGKLITLSAIPLVFWRVLIVSLCLFLWVPVWRHPLAGRCQASKRFHGGASRRF
jgi:hypothetical protein